MPYKLPEKIPATHCLQCGDFIGYGRPDRKFCGPECKNRYHNQHRYPAREPQEERVLRVLRCNYNILRRLLIMGVRAIDLITLRQLGYRQDYVTAYRKQGHKHIYGCFDIEYELTPSRVKRLMFTGEGAGQEIPED